MLGPVVGSGSITEIATDCFRDFEFYLHVQQQLCFHDALQLDRKVLEKVRRCVVVRYT